jgi:hypothetical protein
LENVGWLLPSLLTALGATVGLSVFFAGRNQLSSDPVNAESKMEWIALSLFLIASFVAGVIIWVGIRFEPVEGASVDTKKILGGLSGALTTFLSAAFVKSAEDTGTNWVASDVKAAFKAQFGAKFKPGTLGYRAVYTDIQGIDGWVGRESRQERARLVADALKDPSQLA